MSLIVKAFWVLGIDRTVQNVAGEEAYGFYFSLFSFSVLFTLLLDMGLSGYNSRNVSADPAKVRVFFWNMLVMRLILTLLYFTITLVTAWLMGYSGRQISLLVVLMLNQVIASLILWLRSNISGLQYLITDSILSVADRLIIIIICSVLLWGGVTGGPFRIEWFVWSQTAAYLTVFITALFIVIRKGGIVFRKPDISVIRGIVITGLPYALVAFTMTIYWRTDTVLIERLLPDGTLQAGYYAQAFRLFDAFAMIPLMFGGLLLPIFSRAMAEGSDITPLASMASRMLLAPIGIITVTLATHSEDILGLLYNSPAAVAVTAFSLLMMALMPVGIIYIYSTVMTAAGRMKTLGLITGTGMALNITLNMVLVPSMAGAGAAVAALGTQLYVAILCTVTVHRQIIRVTRLRHAIAFAVMVMVTFATGLISRFSGISWPVIAALQLIMGSLTALILRLIEPVKSIKLLLQKQ